MCEYVCRCGVSVSVCVSVCLCEQVTHFLMALMAGLGALVRTSIRHVFGKGLSALSAEVLSQS